MVLIRLAVKAEHTSAYLTLVHKLVLKIVSLNSTFKHSGCRGTYSTVVTSAAWYMIIIVLNSMTGVSYVTVVLWLAPPSHTC